MCLTDTTLSLRSECERVGMRYTKGYTLNGGKRTDEDRVTTLWPNDDPMSSLTFEEEDGALFCVDSMSPAQCIGAVMGP